MKKTILLLTLATIFLAACEVPTETEQAAEFPEPEYRPDFESIIGDKCAGLTEIDKADCENKEIMRIAISTSDENTCSLIVSEVVQQICKDNVLNARAMNEKDSELCNQIEDAGMKESCLNNLN